jgi:phosphatidylserine/phosphatidylglycerophosphate/cardiolipin synthase-like enzyme
MIQQDVAFALNGVDPIWPDAALERIADLITQRGGDAYIVLSNFGARGAIGRYSYSVPLEAVATRIMDVAAQRSQMAHRPLVDLMCRHLHLAPLRFGPDEAWPGNRAIAVHAKFWMVDDRAFYIGSENLYPANLQEFGYVVEDPVAAGQVRADLWDRAWRWSQKKAISGSEVSDCVLRSPNRQQTASFGRK